MRILLVGGGGREHALAKALARSSRLSRLFCAPGNAGIAKIADCVDIPADDVDGLVTFVEEHKIDLTVVGPEAPLVDGLADRLRKLGKDVFGPNKEAAALEGSKVFTKEILRRYRIPTASYQVFDDAATALEYLDQQRIFPMVVKADGLAAGKGVVVAADVEEANEAVENIMVRRAFGDAGDRVVIEECLKGTEVSIHVITDGRTLLALDTVKDHKAAFDGDRGPNTGGMGTFSPSPLISPQLYSQIESQILVPTVHAMNREGKPFRGLLYAGLMITPAGPKVLEYNVRFGDPEAQALLPRLKTDVVDLMMACSQERLAKLDPPEFDDRASVCVVLTSEGYPGDYKKGYPITGIEEAEAIDGVDVYHAGTEMSVGRLVTTGGRVLGVTALGDDVSDARRKAYEAVDKISFEGMSYRKDIGVV